MRVARPSLLSAWMLLACLVTRAVFAQAHPALGTAPDGLPGLRSIGSPLAPDALNLSATAGYGLTGKVAPARGEHPRALGAIGVAAPLNSWLSVALRLDGRVDFHEGEEGSSYAGAVGDPRLALRAGTRLSETLLIGGELGVWVPGRSAPSFVLAATTLDARGLVAYAPEGSRFALLGLYGLRLDQSAKSAPVLGRLRDGDRASLGLSDSHAVLLGLGASRRFGEAAELFMEVSADFLVGSRAPKALMSPMRAALGGRYFFGPDLQFELTASSSPSERPPIGATDPLVPIEPRFALTLGLRYGFPSTVHARRSGRGEGESESANVSSAAPPERATVAGIVTDPSGGALPEATVVLHAPDGQTRETITDGTGHFRFEDVPGGPSELEIHALGYAPLRRSVAVRSGMAMQALSPSKATLNTGVVRGLVRSFRSEPVVAQILVRAASEAVIGEAESDASGQFSIELPAGSYRITIHAAGYRAQRRTVEVVSGGVTILNADLHAQ